jgi:hypothetical protein
VFELAQVPVQVLVSLGLFYSLYLLVRRILPLGLLCDRLLCLWVVALAFLLVPPVTLLRVPPTCRVRESLSSTPAAVVLTTLSTIELLSICLSRWLPRLLLDLFAALLSRRLVVELPRLSTRRSPCRAIRVPLSGRVQGHPISPPRRF